MRLARLLPWSCLLAAAVPAQNVARTRDWQMDLPPHWRQLTPDEARTLRQSARPPLPEELVALQPAADHPYGAVDRWLQGAFDGRALLARTDAEQDLDAATIARLRRHWETPLAAGGPGGRVERAVVTQLGPDRHPALELVVHLPEHGAEPPATERQFYAPTGGRFVMLRLRARADDFAAADEQYRAMLATLRFARKPRGARQPLHEYLYAIGVGVVVIAILLGVHRRVRRAPPA
jgi:hypothetical protein